jgi:hypothetical protein
MTSRSPGKNRRMGARGRRAIRRRTGAGTIDRPRARITAEVALAKALRALVTRGRGHVEPLDGG